MISTRATGCVLLFATALPAVAGAGTEDRYHQFDDAELQAGRVLWVENCMTCHGYGIAGAPDPNKAKAWRHRLEKPRETLYDHALNGFFGPDGTMMPARGGNDELTDAEVKLAVDYMAAVAQRANDLDQPAKPEAGMHATSTQNRLKPTPSVSTTEED
jgi:cytochrome c5